MFLRLVTSVGQRKKIFFESSDSDDDFRSGFRNVSHHYGQQSFSGLHLPGRSNYTIICNSNVVQQLGRERSGYETSPLSSPTL